MSGLYVLVSSDLVSQLIFATMTHLFGLIKILPCRVCIKQNRRTNEHLKF